MRSVNGEPVTCLGPGKPPPELFLTLREYMCFSRREYNHKTYFLLQSSWELNDVLEARSLPVCSYKNPPTCKAQPWKGWGCHRIPHRLLRRHHQTNVNETIQALTT